MNKFKSSMTEPYPETLRRQLWPLCCGASILSGFKDVMKYPDTKDLTAAIIDAIDKNIPDLQVYVGEKIMPKVTFLTLNHNQMGSKKIMDAIQAAGFVKIGEAKPRGRPQGFFIRDMSKSWEAA